MYIRWEVCVVSRALKYDCALQSKRLGEELKPAMKICMEIRSGDGNEIFKRRKGGTDWSVMQRVYMYFESIKIICVRGSGYEKRWQFYVEFCLHFLVSVAGVDVILAQRGINMRSSRAIRTAGNCMPENGACAWRNIAPRNWMDAHNRCM